MGCQSTTNQYSPNLSAQFLSTCALFALLYSPIGKNAAMFSALAICVVLIIVMAFGAIKEIKAFSTLRKLLKEASRSYGDNGDFLTFCLEYNGWQRFSRSRNYKPEKSKIHVDINRGGGNDDTWSERIQIPQGEPESVRSKETLVLKYRLTDFLGFASNIGYSGC